jgi:hypothetical protein
MIPKTLPHYLVDCLLLGVSSYLPFLNRLVKLLNCLVLLFNYHLEHFAIPDGEEPLAGKQQLRLLGRHVILGALAILLSG